MKTNMQITLMFLGLLSASTIMASAEYYRTMRNGEMPLYRYYDKLPPVYSESSYKPEDMNMYWSERYYGNTNPDVRESLRIEMDIMNMEQRDYHASEMMAKSS